MVDSANSPAQTERTSPEVLHDLPSAYLPDPVFGLMHLPRFLAKIRRYIDGTLPASYQGNFTRGFDGLLCLHLGVEPGEIIEMVRNSQNEADVYAHIRNRLNQEVRASEWNRQFVQMGLSGESKTRLEEIKKQLGLEHRSDLLSFADLIEFDEGRIE
jgi:hypothetical protein